MHQNNMFDEYFKDRILKEKNDPTTKLCLLTLRPSRSPFTDMRSRLSENQAAGPYTVPPFNIERVQTCLAQYTVAW